MQRAFLRQLLLVMGPLSHQVYRGRGSLQIDVATLHKLQSSFCAFDLMKLYKASRITRM